MNLGKLKKDFHQHVKDLQERITQEMKQVDPSLEIIEDNWKRKDHNGDDGGGGRTRAFKGEIIENAGVNTSCVYGAIDPSFATQLMGQEAHLWACGISLIIHPANPRVPTVHANFRFIHQGEKTWFGGGADLTPFYPHEDDFRYFHDIWKKACAPYDCYSSMKEQCDRYFVNHHRDSEMRGIGGIFYDHFNSGDLQKDFKMSLELSNSFIPSYFPLVKKRCSESFSNADVDFQLFRRGRYVEFNLLHDRGTHFGLKTKGRVDSILISLPGRCHFEYCYKPKEEVHRRMQSYYFPKDW